MLDKLFEIDLGKLILSLSVALGFLLAIVTLIRSIEIPIRIYIDRKKRLEVKDKTINDIDNEKGFSR